MYDKMIYPTLLYNRQMHMACVIVAQNLSMETYIWVNTLREIAQEVLTNIILNVYSEGTL